MYSTTDKYKFLHQWSVVLSCNVWGAINTIQGVASSGIDGIFNSIYSITRVHAFAYVEFISGNMNTCWCHQKSQNQYFQDSKCKNTEHISNICCRDTILLKKLQNWSWKSRWFWAVAWKPSGVPTCLIFITHKYW